VTLPNFLIIGAASSGTTSLYRYLAQHPQVFMSPMKETNFFAYEGMEPLFAGPAPPYVAIRSITDLASFEALFSGVRSESAVGEASPRYLYHPEAIERMKRHVPEARLIAILRHPVERAYSNFVRALRDGIEPLTDFGAALQAESERRQRNWRDIFRYREKGLYHAQLEPYLAAFGMRVKIVLHDDLVTDAASLVRGLFGFLGVDESFAPDVSIRHNAATRAPRLRFLGRLAAHTKRLAFLGRMATNVKALSFVPALTQEVREDLLAGYRDDTLALQEVLKRDLSAWRR
jgi:hypothetical protein